MTSWEGLMEAPSATDCQGMDVEISAMGYADDTYGLGTSLRSLQGALEQTQQWLRLTGQDVNGKKSVAFTTEEGQHRGLDHQRRQHPREGGVQMSGGGHPDTPQCKNGTPTSR